MNRKKHTSGAAIGVEAGRGAATCEKGVGAGGIWVKAGSGSGTDGAGVGAGTGAATGGGAGVMTVTGGGGEGEPPVLLVWSKLRIGACKMTQRKLPLNTRAFTELTRTLFAD